MDARNRRIRGVLKWVLVAIAAIIAFPLIAGLAVYPPQYIFRVIAWGDSDAFDWQKFPNHPLRAASSSFTFPQAPDERVGDLFSKVAGVADWESFLAENHTQVFLVVSDGSIVYERYFNQTQRDSMVTSFSVAKSFASALIGIAIDEGYIASVDDPITVYLPELQGRDSRFASITIGDLLHMSSGFEYKEFRFPGFNSDDPLTTYYPDQRWLALNNTKIVDSPGTYFLYNKYHPQLLGIILERSTGMTVTDYLQKKIWNPVGMEYAGSWSTDSVESDFEKMETGVNARAVDFAKFGQLFLNGGTWQGHQVISSAWVARSTQPYMSDDYASYYPEWFSELPQKGYYAYMWWGMADGGGSYDFSAIGDKGQFIYVSPGHSLVVIRNGTDYGIPFEAWLGLFNQFARAY